MITFNHLSRTGLTEAEVTQRAKQFQIDMFDYTGAEYSLQEAVDGIIDAAIEHAQ